MWKCVHICLISAGFFKKKIVCWPVWGYINIVFSPHNSTVIKKKLTTFERKFLCHISVLYQLLGQVLLVLFSSDLFLYCGTALFSIVPILKRVLVSVVFYIISLLNGKTDQLKTGNIKCAIRFWLNRNNWRCNMSKTAGQLPFSEAGIKVVWDVWCIILSVKVHEIMIKCFNLHICRIYLQYATIYTFICI